MTRRRSPSGLDWVARNAGTLHIGVANVSLAVPASQRRSQRRSQAAWQAGVVVVASSGNRPEEGELIYDQLRRPTGPARTPRRLVYPAGYPHVVAVNATARGAGARDLTSRAPELAHRRRGPDRRRGLARGSTAAPAWSRTIATSWAAAEVSGVRRAAPARVPRRHRAARPWPGWSAPPTARPTTPTPLDRRRGRAAGRGADPAAAPRRPRRRAHAPSRPSAAPAGHRARARGGRAGRHPRERRVVGAARRRRLLLALLLRPVLARRRD